MFTTRKIAIDLGTANTLIYVAGQGVVLNEPTVIALSAEDDTIMAIGTDAKKMLGRTPQEIHASRPLKDGVVADYDATEALVRYFIRKVVKEYRLGRIEALVCTPAGATSVERRALLEAVLGAGAKNAYLIEESLVAAIGAGIPIGSVEGNMILDIGGGTSEIAVICLGGIVVHSTEKIGGNHFDDAINQFIRRKYNLLMGDRMAEEVKVNLAHALRAKRPKKIEVKGRNAIDGLPQTIEIGSDDIHDAIKPLLEGIVGSIRYVLEQTPPELASDIIDRGLMVSGGGAMLPGIERLLGVKTGIPVHIAEHPLQCVIRGAGKVVEDFDTYRRHLKKI